MLFGGDGTHCFARKRSRDYEKKSPLHFWRNFSANHNQAHSNLNQKGRSYSIYGIIVSTPHWAIHLTKTSFTLSFYTLSVYIKATWFSHSPTTVLSGLSTLDQIQWLTVKYLVQELTISSKKLLSQLGACCCLKDNSSWTIIWREFQLPLTSKEHMKWGTKYFQV